MPSKPFFERLDPRVRIIWMFLLSALTLHFMEPLPLLLVVLSIIPVWLLARRFLMLVSKVTPKAIAFMLFLAVTQSISQLIMTHTVNPNVLAIQMERVYVMVTASVLLFQTTNYSQITAAIRSLKPRNPESKLAPFIESAAFTVGIAFQMIPTILTEIATMAQVRRARGEAITEGKALERAKKSLRLGMPLVNRMIDVIKNINLALTNYAYSNRRRRTQFRIIRFSLMDYAALLVVFAAALAFLFV
ncbi:energy-coupling factor transporter transmembrane protein EcfT [Patescibacteria group bacterium]|nr:energy-coupling factor transporter transmembrane protein EcfT [Patescibacteria group bacterium]